MMQKTTTGWSKTTYDPITGRELTYEDSTGHSRTFKYNEDGKKLIMLMKYHRLNGNMMKVEN